MNIKESVYNYIRLCMPIFVCLFLEPKLSAISLEDAVLNTLQTNPGVKEHVHNLKSVDKDRDVALSGYYPKLDLSMGMGLAKQKNTPSFNEQSGGQVLRTDNSITASMNVFNGFDTYYELEAQKHRAGSARSSMEEYKASLVMKIIENYIGMMKQKAIVQISKENVFAHKEIYNKLKEFTKSGMGKASDVRFASGRLTLAQVNSVVNENNFIQSKVVFETTLGASVKEGELSEPTFDYELPDTLKEASSIALEFNPSILVGEKNIKSTYSNYKRSKSAYFPSLDMEIKESILTERGAYDYSVENSYAMVYLNYNIFNGFADKANSEKEFAIYLQNKDYLLTTKRDVISKLGVAWVASVKIAEQLKLLDKLRVYSRITLEDYYQEFGIGRRTLLDIINVKNDYNNARQSYESAKYDLLLSNFRILDAMGGLVDYFLSRADSSKEIDDKVYVEDKLINNIIYEMNEKLVKKEDFIKYDESKYITFDTMIKNYDTKDDVSLDPYDTLEKLELEESKSQDTP